MATSGKHELSLEKKTGTHEKETEVWPNLIHFGITGRKGETFSNFI